MVAGEQHRRYGAALPHFGPGILGVFQQAVPVALVLVALFLGQNSRLQAQHAVRHHQAGQFAAGEHVIANGDLLVAERFDHPLVDAFIVAADQRHRFVLRQPSGRRLIVGLARRREKHHMGLAASLGGALGLHGAQAVGDGLGVQHHAAAAAVGVVVGLLLLVAGIVTDLVAVGLEKPFGPRPAQDAGGKEAVAQFREQRDDVDAHGFTPCRR